MAQKLDQEPRLAGESPALIEWARGVARNFNLLFDSDAVKAPLDAFAASKSGNGWQKLPSGLIVQWGFATTTATGLSLSFPIPFPSLCASFVVTAVNNTAVPVTAISQPAGASTVYVQTFNVSTQIATNISWLAIGY